MRIRCPDSDACESTIAPSTTRSNAAGFAGRPPSSRRVSSTSTSISVASVTNSQPHAGGHRDHEAELDVHDLVPRPAREPAEHDPVGSRLRVECARNSDLVDVDLLHRVTLLPRLVLDSDWPGRRRP